MSLQKNISHSEFDRSGSMTESAHPTMQGRIWQHFLGPIFSGLHYGHVEFILPSGGKLAFGSGNEKDPRVRVHIHRHRTLWNILTKGMLGVAESFMSAHWSCDNLARLFDLCLKNRTIYDNLYAHGKLARWIAHLKHLTRANSIRGSRKNISFHYDLGNEFYQLWLDPTMTYSSAYQTADNETLENSQIRKLDRVLELSNARQGETILEIGCGWGAFAERAAHIGCKVEGLTLSTEQLDFSQKRAKAKGFDELARFHLRDYRHEAGQYDAIASIEMIEAVGEEHWPTYFRHLHDNLRPGGRAALQAITIDENGYARYRSGADFIQTFIFPGGMLPTEDHLDHHARKAGLVPVFKETFAPDYAKTLARWSKAFLAQWPQIAKLGYDERFKRMWLFYLAYCEAGFANRTINVGHYCYERPT
ncbi:cyclopropane-fatty-acyl-phospholipid synthase family protein [uncultured Cohaesibacter sp.]|uniref:cyclopropane-fatty-acyl-phospholipid synthase family protein n=1 Tax=uncultured Cohaesibacter sp. TaxID=1002546 RepID=UPI0029C785E4|nr:cyclopropane-fatty-acyl-phospholipid synthase family protein [uncultured Cohaesibacter sp.]